MSKIGRKPIDLFKVKVEVEGQRVKYSGEEASGYYDIPRFFSLKIEDNKLFINPNELVRVSKRDKNRLWGLHRALLANTILGAHNKFVRTLEIVGLGYKVIQQQNVLEFSLGYSHKIKYTLPEGVSVSVEKTGQKLTLTSSDKMLLGLVCSQIRALRKPEPYKGTGIRFLGEEIRRKAGKTKGS
ncbi:MAG: 50S ribosomal protein L6 [Candidatus Babeliales bacterium]